MFTVNNIQTGYGRSIVVSDVSFEIKTGEVCTLLGRNGMGKTTTVKAIFGLLPLRAGQITFDGTVRTGLPPHKIARLGLALVPEGRQIFPNLTVRENLVTTAANFGRRAAVWTTKEVYELFPQLAERSQNMGWQLSGGEQQMLAIGRALMTNPKLIILDEATEGLAPLARVEIWKALEKLKKDAMSILVIDKDIDALARVGDTHYVIEKGHIVWAASSQELLDGHELRRQYLSV